MDWMKCSRIALVLLVAADGMGAQDTNVAGASAVEVLVERARAALNDLQFAKADSLARDVLAIGSRARRTTRIHALQIIAAANFPEIEGDRRLSQARSAIVELLKHELGAPIPREISWSGLDSLYADVVAQVFAMSVTVRRDNPIVGINGTTLLRVRTNRPSAVKLLARSRDGIDLVQLDSVPLSTDTTLMLRVARNGLPILRGGEYEFILSATDPTSREVISRRYDGITIVPTIAYVAVPAQIDSTELVPERTASQRIPGIVGGIVMGAATVALGRALRARGPIKASGEIDRGYTQVAGIVVVGSAAAAWFDRGRFLDRNRAVNAARKRAYEGRRRAVIAENESRAADYRANITLDPEGR